LNKFYHRLDDFENACSAYDKAIDLGKDYLTHLNYAITLYLNDEIEKSNAQYEAYSILFSELKNYSDIDQDIVYQASLLKTLLDAVKV
jgi:Bardet-Biedl syndrome 4 protein